MKYNHHVTKFLLALCVIMLVVTALSYIEPAKIIESIGIQNSYLIVFVLAIIGGVSALTAAGFYATLFSLALGGANPLVLAAFSAPGVLIGDYIFWYLGVEGRKAVEQEYSHHLIKFSSWLSQKPKWFASVIIYIYTGLTPLPGDFLMFALALLNYRFKQIFVPTLLGNYTLAVLVSSFGSFFV